MKPEMSGNIQEENNGTVMVAVDSQAQVSNLWVLLISPLIIMQALSWRCRARGMQHAGLCKYNHWYDTPNGSILE